MSTGGDLKDGWILSPDLWVGGNFPSRQQYDLLLRRGQLFYCLDIDSGVPPVGPASPVSQADRGGHGLEFTSKALDQWAYVNHVTLDFSRPGKPTGNAYIEAFNRRLRAECLNQHWFLSLDDANEKLEA